MSEALIRKSGDLTLVHVLRTGEPTCPKCDGLHENEGGPVRGAGCWDDGPLYWYCDDCGETWGFS